jgi:hypothetical protein
MNLDDNKIPKGSGVTVDDFSSYCEGDIEPTLNKKIEFLIDCDVDYIVYVADDLFAQWSMTEKYGRPISAFATISNRVNQLETLSLTSLRNYQRKALAGLLAEAMARIIGDKNEEKALEVLEMAESFYYARSAENARAWYVGGALITASISFIAVLFLWLLKGLAISTLGNNAFEVLLGTTVGGIGALLSILTRNQKIVMDPTAGPFIHYVESVARVLAGNIGAFIVAVGLKGNLILGFTQITNYSLATLITICTCSGASERIVPGFIKRVESSVGSRGKGNKK